MVFKPHWDLFYKVGLGEIDNQSIKNFVEQTHGFLGRVRLFTNRVRGKGFKPKNEDKQDKFDYDLLVFGKDEQRLDYALCFLL